MDIETPAPRADSARRRPRKGALIATTLAIAALGCGLDQLTKWIVQSTMHLGESIEVLGPWLRWYYILNSGAAFSIGTNVTWIFTIVMTAVIIYVLFLLRHLGSRLWAVALGGLLAGATGNLIDRLFRAPSFGQGHVVDFISVPNFAIFNIADSFVVCSMIGICLLLFRGVGVDGTRAGADGQDRAGEAGEGGTGATAAGEGATGATEAGRGPRTGPGDAGDRPGDAPRDRAE